jgi:hypothetical protein
VPKRALAYGLAANGTIEQQTPIGNIIGAGGLLTTVGDLLKWNENFVHARVGGQDFVKAQQKPAVLTGGRTTSYAAGLMLATTDGLKEVAHSGSTGGYRTWLGRYPEQGVSVAVMCNSAEAVPTQLGRQTARLWTGAKAQLMQSTVESTHPQTLAGMYRVVRDQRAVDVKWKDGRLWLGSATELMPAGPGKLRLVANDDDVIFEKVEPVQPSAADLAQLVGEYASAETASKLVVSLGDQAGELKLRVGMTAPMTLKPTYKDAFAVAGGSILFRRDGTGKVVELSAGDARVWDLRFARVK